MSVAPPQDIVRTTPLPDKPWRRVSASQISTFRACPTLWWWEQRAGYRPPPTEAQKRGTRLHKAWERYLIDGTIPEDPIAVSTLEHLPAPGSVPAEYVEARIDQSIGLPVPLLGFIDLLEPDARRVTDHKTTSDFRYCKAPEELASDPQALVYCYEFLARFDGPACTFRHVYARTTGRPESTTREVLLSRDYIAEQYERQIIGTANEMAKYADASVHDVPHNISACSRYGGCPHAARCLLLGKTFGTGLAGVQTMSNDRTADALALLFRRPGQAAQPAPAPVVEQPAPVADLAPTVNPPDGLPTGQELPKAAPDKPASSAGRKDGPYLRDGTRVRGLKMDALVLAYAAELRGLSPQLLEAWRERSSKAIQDWRDDGCPTEGRGVPLRRELLADAIWLEQLREAGACGVLPAQDNTQAHAAVMDTPIMDTPAPVMDSASPGTVTAADAAPGMYRSSKGYLVEVLGGTDKAGYPLARYWPSDNDEPRDVALVPTQELVPVVVEPYVAISLTVDQPVADEPHEEPASCEQPTAEDEFAPECAESEQKPAEQPPAEEKYATAQDAPAQPVTHDNMPGPAPTVAAVDAMCEQWTAPQEQAHGRTLYIGCVPLRGGYVLAENLAQPYTQQVAEANAVPYYGLLDYGKGARQVVALILQAVQANPASLPADLVIDPRHPLGDALAEALAPYYDQIVKRLG